MKRLLLTILAACAAALVAWRLSRYEEPRPQAADDDAASEPADRS